MFTCIFLDKDKDKGGSDPTCLDAGDAIWTYVIVRLILGWLGGVCGRGRGQEEAEDSESSFVGPFCQFCTSLTTVIYGGIVIFSKDVCEQYKNTGLYQMYYIMYWIDVLSLCIITCTLSVGFLSPFCGGPPPQELHQSIRSSISRNSINLGLGKADAPDALDTSDVPDTADEADSGT